MKTEIASVLSAVEAEETRLRAALHRIQNERVPAVALPYEVLAAIFNKACERPPNVTAVYGANIPDTRKWRNAINATCYRWRQVALATSSLWSDILLTAYPRPAVPNRLLIPIELERSNGRTLTTRAVIAYDEEEYEFFSHTITTLCPLSSTLDLLVLAWITPFRLLEGRIPLHNLRHLQLHLIRRPDVTDDPERIDLSQANSLHFVSLYIELDFIRGGLKPLHLRPPETPTISDLDISGDVDPCDVVRFIARCSPHLHTLRWRCTRYASEFPHEVLDTVPSDSVYFPQLEHLYLAGQFPVKLMQRISAPKLVLLVANIADPAVGVRDERNILLMDPYQFPALRHLRYLRSTGPIGVPVTTFLTAHAALEEVGPLTLWEIRTVLNPDSQSGEVPLPNLRHLWLATPCFKQQTEVDTYTKVLGKILEFLISQCTSSKRPPFVVHIVQGSWGEGINFFNALYAFTPYVQQSDLYGDKEPPSIWVDEWDSGFTTQDVLDLSDL